LNVNSGGTMSGQGNVVFVLGNKSFNLQNGDNFTFSGLEVFTSGNGVFRVGGNLTVTDHLRYYAAGTGNFAVLSGGSVNAQNAYMYLNEGNIEWESSANLNMHAPPQDDPDGLGGLLVHKPYGNDKRITFNGGSNVVLYGTFMAPTSPITLNGQAGFELHSQIIGWDYLINGGAKADIWYEADENYNPPVAADPTIEFTK
ncbi:MAG TPA: hypothetical protein VKP08_11140, partial [Anaerolineales bacterium]|nr:hypothetical protein [Anaerolineales bacterium]